MEPIDTVDDPALRPQTLAAFTDQPRACKLLSMALAGARCRGDQLDHVLFYGSPGFGKTTVARIVSVEAGGRLQTLAAPFVQCPGDLASILVRLQLGDYLFLDEIHRRPLACFELLYGAMEDFRLDLLTTDAGSVQAVSILLPRFT